MLLLFTGITSYWKLTWAVGCLMAWAAKSARRWVEKGRWWGAGCLQPRNLENGALQQMAGDGGLPLRRELPIRPRNQWTTAGDQAPALQDSGLPHGARRRPLPLRPPLPLPPLSHRSGAPHGGTAAAALILHGRGLLVRVVDRLNSLFHLFSFFFQNKNSTYTIH